MIIPPALNTQTGEGLGNAVPQHPSDEFVAFLAAVVDTQPRALLKDRT